jgi:hypothetical protein
MVLKGLAVKRKQERIMSAPATGNKTQHGIRKQVPYFIRSAHGGDVSRLPKQRTIFYRQFESWSGMNPSDFRVLSRPSPDA